MRERSALISAVVTASAVTTVAMADAQPTAQYRVTFTGLWTAATHPIDFPSNAHFSPLIGGTHDEPDLLWAPGATPTPGIESMAETGSKTALRNEVLAFIANGSAFSVIESPGGGGSTATFSADFTIDQDFPYASVVTMIAPSPDWFVGTHDVRLFENGVWVPELVFLLEAYDAGSDDGVTYTSGNDDTDPKEPIIELIGYPVAPRGLAALPFGEMRFTRLFAPPCPADLDGDGAVNGADLTTLLGMWGDAPGSSADLTENGTVDGGDLAILLANWGGCP